MKNKALFLDRDGVINVEKNYVHRIEDFEFVEGIFDVTRFFYEHGYLLIIVTNQAGIGRGYYTERDFHELTEWMTKQFEINGVKITKVYYCPYHPEHGIGEYKKDSFNRKPNPGMILDAQRHYNIDLGRSFLIGDKESDILAGRSAGVGTTILINPKQNKTINSSANVIVESLKSLISITRVVSECQN